MCSLQGQHLNVVRASLLLFAVLGASACASTRPSDLSPDCRRLEAAYATADSLEGLSRARNVFDEWAQASVPLDSTERSRLDLYQRAALEIFEAYYEPERNVRDLNGEEYNRERTKRRRYDVLNPVMRYEIVKWIEIESSILSEELPVEVRVLRWNDSVRQDNRIRRDTLNTFRPRIEGHRVIYLTPARWAALTCFLRNDHRPPGSGSLMSPAVPQGKSRRRASFLRSEIPIIGGHNGGWQLQTQPFPSFITFDEKAEQAILHIRLGYEGGEAIFRKQNGRWALVSQGLTWIE